jgi:1,4-alpha-glucan branching enzyme
VDFPRDGNNESFQHARRQWSLADNGDLRYADLERFDAALQTLDKQHHVLPDPLVEELSLNEGDKVLVYRRGPLVFAVNFHPTASYTGYRIPVPDPSDYGLALDTDDVRFGGHGRVEAGAVFARQTEPFSGREQSVYLYLPSRTGLVLAPVS